MASFPALATGKVAMYGSERGRRFATEVAQFCDDREQRWPTAQGCQTFGLNLVDLDGYEMANVEEFFRSMKGRFDTTWDITVGGVTYSNMLFDVDQIAWTFSRPLHQSARIPCRQWRP